MTDRESDKAPNSMSDAITAMQQWCDEIDAVNRRWATKVIDQIAIAEREAGWPDRASSRTGLTGTMNYFMLFSAVRDRLIEACNLQTDAVRKVAEGCFSTREE